MLSETYTLPCLRLAPHRHDGDCTIVALARLTGLSYEDVLGAASVVVPIPHREGMQMKDIIKTADILGIKLKRKKKFDVEESFGILDLRCLKGMSAENHVALLRWGLIFESSKDGNPEVWEYEAYLLHFKAKVRGILVMEGN